MSGDDSGKRSETYSFPWYKRFIETHTDFDECKINIILTINFNGVKGKTLTVCRSRKTRSKASQSTGITMSKKTLTETLLREMFSRSALKTLYDLPRWQSQNGCHLCTFEGERRGHRVIWFPRFPYAGDRRTFASITRDAMSNANGR
ncbi:hypothetical protein COOONC_06929 [Cooperia oncophora]